MDAEVDDDSHVVEIAELVRDPVRLAALDRYAILDTPSEQAFDDLAVLAGQICRTPVALISLVAADRQFFKARAGLAHRQSSLAESFCVAALGHRDLLVIPDLAADRRTRANPLVTASPGYGFYAGVPLRTPDGHALGTLCVIDTDPRPHGLSEAEAFGLKALARQVMAQIETRRALAERDGMLHAQQRMIDQQAALIATQDEISGARGDLEAILDSLVAGAMKAVDAAEGGVIEVRQGEHLVYKSSRGTLEPHLGLRVPLRKSLAGSCFLTNRALLCADALRDGRTTPELAGLLGTRSCLLVPVSRRDKVIGVLKLQSSRVGAFTERDLQVVRLFAGAAAAGFAEASDAASRRAARSAEGRYRAVFDSAIDFAIIVMDLDGRVMDWNAGAERILGWSREEMVGRPAEVFFTPEDGEEGMPRREMRIALLDGRGIDERWHLRKDGTRFWANGEMMTLRADDGKAIGFLKILRDRTARHAAEERIMASERRLRFERGLLQAVVEQAPVGITIAFADGEAALVNACMQAMVGAEAMSDGAIVAGERRAKSRNVFDELVTRALRGGESIANEVVRRPDPRTGEMRHWTVSSTPIRGEGERVLAAVSIVVDVDDQRRAMQALEVSEERLALAFEASGSMGWWDWDVPRERIYFSGNLVRSYGFGAEAASKGLPVAAFTGGIHADDRARIEHRLKVVLMEGGEFAEEFRIQAAGQTIWINARGRCYLGADGRSVRFPGVAVDITARKAIEAEIKARQAELDILVEAVPIGILLAEAPSGRITLANRRAARILGPPFAGEIGRFQGRHGSRAQEQGADALEAPLSRITRGECDRAEFELHYRHPDGGQLWISVAGEAVKNAAGETVGAVVAVADIEERKTAEAQQAILNHELSHRMKNTLAMVQAVATQTLRNAPDLASARDALDDRLFALGKAHDILLAGNAPNADVAAVIDGTLHLHDDRQGRIVASGPALPIPPSMALSLALMIHELATNAVKYGALSVGQGRVAVTWAVRSEAGRELFALSWRELGGPPVAAPTRKGFGSRLIERGFGSTQGSSVTLAYHSDGVQCDLTVPMDRFRAKPGT